MPGSCVCIGIAGGSGTGKTSLATALRERLRAVSLLSQDWYYRDRSGWDSARHAALSFDEPASLELNALACDVRALVSGASIKAPQYCFRTHTRTQAWIDVVPNRYVVVEGTLLFTEPRLTDLFDKRLYLESPSDVRLSRRLQRDVAERGRSADDVIRQYASEVEPMHERYVAPQRALAHDVFATDRLSLDVIVEAVVSALDD